MIVELKPRADNIANDCPQHRMASFKESHPHSQVILYLAEYF